MSTFWIVVSSVRGPAPLPHRHTSEANAVLEAERLANIYDGEFYVMQAKSVSVKKSVITTKLDDDEGPF